MPRSRPISTLAALVLALAAGCGSPEIQIEAFNKEDQGKVYFRPTYDGQGNELKGMPETMIGNLPTDWEVPSNLLGGRAAARVEFADGATKTIDQFSIDPKKDTRIRVTKPPVPRK